MTESEILRAEKQQTGATGHVSRRTLWILGVLAILGIVVAFFAGYLPHQKNQQFLNAEAKTDSESVPEVTVAAAERSAGRSELVLPANIQAVTEAPVLARATGYIKLRSADIGDRVAAGQVLAEIDAGELDQQVRQAKAALDQANAALEQAQADLEQGRTNQNLARITAERWKNLADRGVVSKQENDTRQAEYESSQARVRSLQKAINVAASNRGSAEANLARLNELHSYLKVRAPFAGVITQRNVDVGALVNEGNTLLYRIAQTDRLRTYVNVPQSDADSVHPGQTATLTIPDLPSQKFVGTVTRTANSLDPASRTLLTEVQVPNPNGILLPGMYAQVDLTTPRSNPPLVIPGDTLVVRTDGPQVAVVTPQHKVHYQRIQIGRDYGDKLEVLTGLQEGQQIVVNPGDTVREGAPVRPLLLKEKPAPKH